MIPGVLSIQVPSLSKRMAEKVRSTGIVERASEEEMKNEKGDGSEGIEYPTTAVTYPTNRDVRYFRDAAFCPTIARLSNEASCEGLSSSLVVSHVDKRC